MDKWSSGLLTEASLVFKYCEIQLLQLIPKIQRQQQRSQRQKAKLKNHQYRTSSFQGKCNDQFFRSKKLKNVKRKKEKSFFK